MKNFLAPIAKNPNVSKITGTIGKFYRDNEGAFLTGGTIIFSCATTAVTFANATSIIETINNAKEALANCSNENDRKKVYEITIKELAPKVGPILLLQAATIFCAVKNKKQYDKRVADAISALSLAQQAVAYYQSFQKEAEESLGEKKVAKIQKEIAEKTVYEASASPVNSKKTDDDQLVYEPITGQVIWSTPDRIDLGWIKYRETVRSSSEMFVPFGEVFFDEIGADSSAAAAEVFGYMNEDADRMSDSVHLDTTKVIINGKEMAALKMNYYPAPTFFGEIRN